MTAMGEAAHFKLRAPRQEDSDTLFRWINDRELVLLNSAYAPVTRSDHDVWFARIFKDAALQHFFMIETCADSRAVGSCQLTNVNRVHGNANLQIRIGERDAWGLGIGTEAVRLLVKHAFSNLGLHRVQLHVFADNARAQRAYLKAGFLEEGRSRHAAFIDGQYVDIVNMSILNE